jgi:hypothetical protein
MNEVKERVLTKAEEWYVNYCINQHTHLVAPVALAVIGDEYPLSFTAIDGNGRHYQGSLTRCSEVNPETADLETELLVGIFVPSSGTMLIHMAFDSWIEKTLYTFAGPEIKPMD